MASEIVTAERDRREQEARMLALICERMGMPPLRVLTITAHAMAMQDAADTVKLMRTLADGIEFLHAEPQGNA